MAGINSFSGTLSSDWLSGMSTPDVQSVAFGTPAGVAGGGAGAPAAGAPAGSATDGWANISGGWVDTMAANNTIPSGVDMASFSAGMTTGAAGGGAAAGGISGQISSLMNTIAGVQNGTVSAQQAQAALAGATNTLNTAGTAGTANRAVAGASSTGDYVPTTSAHLGANGTLTR